MRFFVILEPCFCMDLENGQNSPWPAEVDSVDEDRTELVAILEAESLGAGGEIPPSSKSSNYARAIIRGAIAFSALLMVVIIIFSF